jgi:hypothetical protein
VCCYTTLVVLWDCYGLVCDSLACVPSWNFVSKKSSRTFVIPARTSLRSHAPAFMSPTCGSGTHVSMLRICRRTLRTSLRSHSACHSLLLIFFFFVKGHQASSASRDRVINAPCDPSAPRPLAARAGLHFCHFFRPLLRVDFSSFF